VNRPASIAVFGSSEPGEGAPLYEEARRVGALLASAGYGVVRGGYGGVMDGASRGAVESGGTALGVVCDVFGGRPASRHLTETVATPNLFERTRTLVDRSDGFVVLHGKSGTLAELAWLWALHRAGCLGRRPVILLGGGYRSLLRHLVQSGMIESEQFDITRVVDSPEEALQVLEGFLAVVREG
jgi:uncharacterized protein (TIGR00730 family)